MLRFVSFAVVMALCLVALGDDLQPIEIQFIVIELANEQPRNAEVNSSLDGIDFSKIESDEWTGEVQRLRPEGNDVRVRRLTVKAYEALPAHVEFFSDHSAGSGEQDDDERDQAAFSMDCLTQERDDGAYSLEFSFRDESRDGVPRQHPLLDLSPTTTPSGTPTDALVASTTIVMLPGEWTMMGGSHTSSTDEIGTPHERSRKTSTITLIRVTESE